MVPVLHAFQLDLVERVRTARAAGARIIVVQGATGCGKNTIAAYIVRCAAEKGMAALCIVHRRKLVDQISERLFQFEVSHGILMRGQPCDRGARITVASRDTLLSRCLNNRWSDMPPADLVIVDEAHHAADPASEYRRILANYPRATILLLSATPVGPDGRGLGPWAQAIECAAPTSQLVRDGFLCPVKVFAPDRKRFRGKVRRGIAGDLVESWKQYGEDRPTVLFLSRVQYSLDAVKAYKEADIPAAHLDADTPEDERERIFEDVASGRIKILSNVGIVGEGVDVPELGCCQLYCEVNSRVRFLQAVGRIMRSFLGKAYGILIDHSGAVFRHGFPDEDTEWSLDGNADEEFAKRHDAGETEKAFYCKRCELVYHGAPACPQCGREPVKPPRSVFAPPPIDHTNEVLTEAERGGDRSVYEREEKVRHWLRCLGAAANRGGSFGQAAAIFKNKYQEFPGDDFPCVPERWNWKAKVKDVYPQFGRKAKQP